MLDLQRLVIDEDIRNLKRVGSAPPPSVVMKLKEQHEQQARREKDQLEEAKRRDKVQ